jgi:signal peptidase II
MSEGSTPPPSLAASGQPKIEFPASRLQRLRAYQTLLALAVVVFIADQLTKLWIVRRVPFDPFHSHRAGSDITVIPGFFHIIHIGNPGAAWSMFSGQSVLLAWLAAATLAAIAWWRHALGLRARLPQIAFGLLCGGIVGNLVDRVRYGHVVDFIDLHFGTYIYPTFNVADSGICVGVILYLLHSLRAK